MLSPDCAVTVRVHNINRKENIKNLLHTLLSTGTLVGGHRSFGDSCSHAHTPLLRRGWGWVVARARPALDTLSLGAHRLLNPCIIKRSNGFELCFQGVRNLQPVNKPFKIFLRDLFIFTRELFQRFKRIGVPFFS